MASMNLFRYLMTATDVAKRNLRMDKQERLIQREVEGKIDSLELQELTLENDLLLARQEVAGATADNIKSKLQGIIDLRLKVEACQKAQGFLKEELKALFEDEFTPPSA